MKKLRQYFDNLGQNILAADFIYKEVASRLLERLQYVKIDPKNIVDVGSGAGFDSQLILHKYQDATLYNVDFSLQLAKLAKIQNQTISTSLGSRYLSLVMSKIFKKQYQALPQCNYICAEAGKLPILSNSADLVWSNLTLPYILNLDDFFKEIRRVLKVGGALMLSGLGVDSLKELRQIGLNTVDFPDMHLIGDMLLKLGFTNPVIDMEYINLEYDELELLLLDIKKLGGKYGLIDKSQVKTMTRGKLNHLLCSMPKKNINITDDENNCQLDNADGRLNKGFTITQHNGRYNLTLEVFYAHAWKDNVHLDLPDGVSGVKFYR